MKAISLWNPWGAAIVAQVESPAAVAGRAWTFKRVENRDWREGIPALAVARALVGSTIFLHASKRHHKADFDETVEGILDTIAPTPVSERLAFLKALGVTLEVPLRGKHHGEGRWAPLPSMAFGAIIGRAQLADVTRTTAGGHRLLAEPMQTARTWRCLLCGEASAVRLWDFDCPKADPWAVPGDVGLLLADVERLVEPVLYAGRQGWFEVPDHVLAGAQWKAVQP